MGWGFRGSSHCGVWGWCSKRPGDRGQCRGTTTEHRSSPWAPHQPKLACNSGARTFCSTRKRCNSNDAISTFDIRAGELHATFLRKQHEVPQKPHAEDNSSPEDPHNPDSRHKHGGTAPNKGHCTRYVAAHPNRRGVMPTDRVHCLLEQVKVWSAVARSGLCGLMGVCVVVPGGGFRQTVDPFTKIPRNLAVFAQWVCTLAEWMLHRYGCA